MFNIVPVSFSDTQCYREISKIFEPVLDVKILT